MAYCDYACIDSASKILRDITLPEYNYREIVIDWKLCPGPGTFFLREPTEKCGGWNPKYPLTCDREFWVRLGLYGEFKRVPKVRAYYRVHVGSQTYSNTSHERCLEPIRSIQEFFARSDVPASIRAEETTAVGNAYLLSAVILLRARHYKSSLGAFQTAFRYNPRAMLRARVLKMFFKGLLFRTAVAVRSRLSGRTVPRAA